MSNAIDQLAAVCGISPDYMSETGERRVVSNEVKAALLAAMGIDARDEAAAAVALAHGQSRAPAEPRASPCFVPRFLCEGRIWGITCQLYSVASARNGGFGDFEDLACLCEIGARAGADFIGTNPLHALFASEPARASPYSPSSRRFLNPLYIALDRPPANGGGAASPPPSGSSAGLIDYASVARWKWSALEAAFAAFGDDADFQRFQQEGGPELQAFALFEALSEEMSREGHGSSWHSWPDVYRNSRCDAVAKFASERRDRIDFFVWTQWVAERQLASAQDRARTAGMRIGLYLDFAVGVAPDGMETWWDPDLVVAAARVGAPPDMFNAEGQDWGLAPLSPAVLRARDLVPFARDMEAVMRCSGAVRIDHVMALQRLFWIPSDSKPSDGGYVEYPLESMLSSVCRASHRLGALVIGEDLGTVPAGFRERMREAEVQSYRLLVFERGQDGGFLQPDAYPREALACLLTHDLPTLEGWWAGLDISARERVGLFSPERALQERRQRADDRVRLADALAATGLLSSGERDAVDGAEEMPEAIAVGAHVYVARSPSRLMAAQLEDLVGEVEQVNLPGTDLEYPNWRRIMRTPIESIETHPRFVRVASELARERPRQ